MLEELAIVGLVLAAVGVLVHRSRERLRTPGARRSRDAERGNWFGDGDGDGGGGD